MTPRGMPSVPALSIGALGTVLAAVLLSPILAAHAPVERTGRQIYSQACAQCHGVDGKGADRSAVGFTLPLPDLSDCNFTREPDADWAAVIQEGGPIRAFDRLMPAFGDALGAHEIDRVIAHVRTFCGQRAWPPGELNLPRALFTEKAFPEDEAVLTTSITTADGSGAAASKLVFEKRVGTRSQFEVVLPFSFTQRGGQTWYGGLGDLVFGGKHVLYHSRGRGTILSAAGEIILPTGKETSGFGKGQTLVEPFVSFGQVLPSDAFVQAQAGLELPTDTSKANREAFWRIAAGKTFTQGGVGRAWSPMVELLAARELVSHEDVLWDLVPQCQVTLSTRQHIMASAGIRFPLNKREGRHPQVVVYLLWDWFDGPLFGGW